MARRQPPAQRKRGKPRPARRSNNQGRIYRAPAAVGRISNGGQGQRNPTSRTSGKNMTITHRERFTSVVTTGTGFEINSFSLNPGLSSVFPWLADIANRFDKYKFRKLAFHYTPQSAAAAGAVTLAFDFDPNDPAPTSTSEASTYQDYVTTSIWQPAMLSVDLASGDKLPQKNTRPGEPDESYDLNNYDVGNFYVMSEGAAAGSVGYVEVVYTVDLYVHQTQNAVGAYVNCSTGVAAGSPFGTGPVVDNDGFLPGQFTSGTVFTFTQPFQGIINWATVGTGLGTDRALVASASGTAQSISQTVNSTSLLNIAICRIKAVKGTTITPTITATTVTGNQLWFTSAPYNTLG